jgi:putative oxidoreductase
MKQIFILITNIYAPALRFHITLLFFRIVVAIQLMLAHGLKKIGIGVANAETVPNPLHLPEILNQVFAEAANLVFPGFVIIGMFTRIAVLPILAVTLTGFFVVHFHDTSSEKDIPLMYSVAYLLLLSFGPGKFSADFYINRKLRK